MRFAAERSSSGWTVRSSLATMYQLGFDFQATPSTFCKNRSGTGAAWVAHTTCCSVSGRSPAKTPDAAWLEPDPPVGHLDVREDVRDRELLLLALRGFGFVG